jgi:ATP-dependent helicase/nuclease subunit B
MHLYGRLRSLAYIVAEDVAEEFSVSEFSPAFFELRTNGEEGAPKPLELTTDGGRRVVVSGIIDRVDHLKLEDDHYIRVIDYKTGDKDISVDDVMGGYNLQMLLYLFTLCDSENTEFHKSLGIESGKAPIPSGVMYLSSNIPFAELDDIPENKDGLSYLVKKGLKRSGLLLGDREVLHAMNGLFESKYLAGIKENANGELVGKALVPKEEFDNIREAVLSDVRFKADCILSGQSFTYSGMKKEHLSCEYCEYRPICRKDNVLG